MLKPTSILSQRQLFFLDLFNESDLKESFYLTGGTALCGFYIPYRYSEDLDFFSVKEIDIQSIVVWLRSIKDNFDYQSFDLQTVLNRNLIFLQFGNELLKTEFTFFPFPPKCTQEKYKEINIDSSEDLALNKLFTIYQKPRLRDFMDLYKMIQKFGFSFNDLRQNARIKFDWDINPIQLGSQLLKVKEGKDIPKLRRKFDYKKMEDFFLTIARDLGKEIIE